jgi:outer membrane protein OmpA-like peptidoglycan-associated protein
MIRKAITIGALALAAAAPAAAQERGTLEFGAFGSAGAFNKSLTLDNGFGVGGHVGMYLDPRWAVEFEGAEMSASRPTGLANANVGMLSGRVVGTFFRSGPLSLMLGAGAGASTETSWLHSYGVNALLGAKFRVMDNAAIRLDAVSDWLANYSWKSNQRLQLGMTFTRRPNQTVRTVEVAVAAAPYVQRADSVNAEEQGRRRRMAQDYRDLRDSLNNAPAPAAMAPSSAAALATMEEKIHFATDKSELSPESKALLDEKVRVFSANPAMRIVIVGNTDKRASDAYNMGLGERRSAAAKAYLVAKGVDAGRIEISSRGERNPIATGTSKDAEATNRRDGFRLIIGSDYLVPVKP